MKKNLYIEKAKKFIFEDLWEIDFNALSFLKKVLVGSLKVSFMVVRGFSRDNCPLHASALTYITLMSMVPLVALMFSAAKGFGAGQKLRELVTQNISQMPENVQEFITNLLGYVENTNFGVLGAVGVLLLFYTVIVMIGKIERSFNTIWGVREERTFFRKFSDYISVLLIVPILIIAATSINATLNSNTFILFLQAKVPYFAALYQSVAGITGIVFVWVAFSFVFMFIPNTKVKWVSALVGGIVAGTLWHMLQWAYISLQVGVAKYNAIYGTFASVPIFLAWLYLCWLIVLFGCEVSFALQNYKTYEEESHSLKANQSTRESLAISLMFYMSKHFEGGKGAWNYVQFSLERQIPIRLVRDIIHRLHESSIVMATDNSNSDLVPGRPLEVLKVKDILAAMRGVPSNAIGKKVDHPNYTEETTLKELSQLKEGEG